MKSLLSVIGTFAFIILLFVGFAKALKVIAVICVGAIAIFAGIILIRSLIDFFELYVIKNK